MWPENASHLRPYLFSLAQAIGKSVWAAARMEMAGSADWDRGREVALAVHISLSVPPFPLLYDNPVQKKKPCGLLGSPILAPERCSKLFRQLILALGLVLQKSRTCAVDQAIQFLCKSAPRASKFVFGDLTAPNLR